MTVYTFTALFIAAVSILGIYFAYKGRREY